uniref:Uncharacterized protein n=1 Tax=Macrostomum lignano TaxID=282301 RepID=A0A1I8F5I3_9PLAT
MDKHMPDDQMHRRVDAKFRVEPTRQADKVQTVQALQETNTSGGGHVLAVLLRAHLLRVLLQRLHPEYLPGPTAAWSVWTHSLEAALESGAGDPDRLRVVRAPPAARRHRRPSLADSPGWLRRTTAGFRNPVYSALRSKRSPGRFSVSVTTQSTAVSTSVAACSSSELDRTMLAAGGKPSATPRGRLRRPMTNWKRCCTATAQIMQKNV